MSWTTPVERTIGTLITKAIWDSDIRYNLRYLKGMDGQITLNDDVIPGSSSLTLGESANPWGAGHFYALYAGPRYVVHRSIREVSCNWPTDQIGDYNAQFDIVTGGNGTAEIGGTGQLVLGIDDDNSGDNASINSIFTTPNNALDSRFTVTKNPYFRCEFAIDSLKACQKFFIGFREQGGTSSPGSSEKHAGLYMDDQAYFGSSCNGSFTTTDPASSPSAGARHVVEIFVISGSAVEIWIDGTQQCNIESNLPTGLLVFTAMLYSEGSGGVGEHSYLTIGKMIAQEDLG